MKPFNGRLHPEDKGVPGLYNQAAKMAKNYDPAYDATEEECVGRLIALHFAWSPESIMEVFKAALEDANAHTYARRVRGWLESDFISDTKVFGG
jgi:hypothetical protein